MQRPRLKDAKQPYLDDNNFLTSGTSISCQARDKSLFLSKIVGGI